MRVVSPNGMVERFDGKRRRPRTWEHYGRTKEGSPGDGKSLEIAAKNDRRGQRRQMADPLRGRFLDLTT